MHASSSGVVELCSDLCWSEPLAVDQCQWSRSVGVENVRSAGCRSRGVRWSTQPGSVTQLSAAVQLAASTQPRIGQALSGHCWPHTQLCVSAQRIVCRNIIVERQSVSAVSAGRHLKLCAVHRNGSTLTAVMLDVPPVSHQRRVIHSPNGHCRAAGAARPVSLAQLPARSRGPRHSVTTLRHGLTR